jgi:hypothetical protein
MKGSFVVETIGSYAVGVLIFVVGFLVGYIYHHPEPLTKEILLEIKALQQDVVRVESQSMENFIKIEYLEHWRDSIVFRPPERETIGNKKQ